MGGSTDRELASSCCSEKTVDDMVIDDVGIKALDINLVGTGCLSYAEGFESVDKAGGSLEPGGLRLSGARGLVECPPLSFIFESTASTFPHPGLVEDDVSLRDAVCLPELFFHDELLYVDSTSEPTTSFVSLSELDLDINVASQSFPKDDSFSYYIRTDPIYCKVEFDPNCSPLLGDPVTNGIVSFWDSSSSRLVHRPCGVSCSRSHELDHRTLQLNPCVFFDELFGGPVLDPNASFLFDGVVNGFKIVDDDFEGSYHCQNYDSILQKDASMDMGETVLSELASQKISLVDSKPSSFHSLGAIRKHDGSICPIMDCKRPLGTSINTFMDTVCTTFSYISRDDVTDVVQKGDFMAVLDIKGAYRSVNVFPDHRKFQGFVWNINGIDSYFEDNRLCFGLKCAPYLYTQITEFIVRAMENRGVARVFGYLDDFIVVAESEARCKEGMSVLIDLLTNLGFEIAWKKVTQPLTCVTYLGIGIDSVKMEVRLPKKKLTRLVELVSSFKGKNECCFRDLQVLCGHLAHAAKVVRGGRTFSRRVINFTTYSSDGTGKCVLPDWFKEDIEWWVSFCALFNGKCPIISNDRQLEIHVETDSSMTGFGAKCGSVNTGRSCNIASMYWLRELFWLSFIFEFHCVSSYVKSEENVIPDFLSRYADPKRGLQWSPALTSGLCCFRNGRIEEAFEGSSEPLDGRQHVQD